MFWSGASMIGRPENQYSELRTGPKARENTHPILNSPKYHYRIAPLPKQTKALTSSAWHLFKRLLHKPTALFSL
nr:hypothetical protein Q903MT_gene1242 [Picea sitchensis]